MGIRGDDSAAGLCGLHFWYWSRLKRYKNERRPLRLDYPEAEVIKVMRGRLKEGIEFLMLAEAGEWTGGEASDAFPEDSLDKPIINHPGKLIFKVPIFHEISELQSID